MSCRILFVDDEPEYLKRYSDELKRQGHSAAVSICVEDALIKIQANEPDLVVLDIMLPLESLETLLRRGVSAVRSAPKRDVSAGIELYKVLRAKYPHVKVIILSVLSEAEIREKDKTVEYECRFLQKGRNDAFDVFTTISGVLDNRDKN